MDMKLYANLHTHSTHSDGGFSPAQLATAAKNEGYGAVALTDHDTVTGYTELRKECEKLGLETIFGAEFSSPSTLLDGIEGEAGTFHICGYHFDPEYPPMKQYLKEMSLRETDQTKTLFERGVRFGKIKGIEWEEVLEFNKGITWLCNDHLWRALLAKGLMKPSDRGWVDTMKTGWQGKDNTAFSNQISRYQSDFREMSVLCGQYAEFLRNSAKSYRQVQDDLASQANALAK